MLAWISLAFASIALLVSLYALTESLAKRPAPVVAKLRTEVADLTDAYERLQRNLRRLQMRLNAEKNARTADQEAPKDEMDPEEWKKQMRVKLHAGRIAGG